MKEKLVPELRFSAFMGNWEKRKVSEIAQTIMGQSPKSESYNSNGKGLPLIQGNADIKNGFSHPRQWTSDPSKVCEIDDIILAVRAPVGLVAKSRHKASIGRGVCVLRSKSENNTEFIYQFLLSFEDQWKRIEQGSTFTAISGSDINNLKLYTPSLPEQQKIADFLTSVDQKIQALTRKVDLLKDYKKGVMQKVFKQEMRFKDADGNVFPRWKDFKLDKLFNKVSEKGINNLPLYSVTLHDGMQPRESLDRLVHNESESSSNLIVRKGDIAYNMMRMWQGAFGVAYEDCIVSPAYVVVRPKENINEEFFKCLFDTSEATYKFWSYSYGLTSDRLRLYPKDFLSIKFYIPCYEEQTKIANFLTSIDDKISAVEGKLEKMKEWKKGLLQKMFV